MAAATFQIAELRKAFADHGGAARGNKYKIEITGGPLTVPEDLQLMCDTISLPTRSAATNELSMYGPVQSFPYRFTYTEASLNFYLTEDFAIKTLFDTWQEVIIDPVSGNLGYFDDYKCKINIQKFGAGDKDTTVTPDYQVTLIDAWPSIVGEVALGHSLGGDILKLPVTFQFRKWVVGTGGNFPNTPPPSDYRLKNNITLLQEEGFGIPNIYSFNYRWDTETTWIGVMAQELLDTGYSDAVGIDSKGFYWVDYTRLGFPMVGINNK